MQLRDYQQQLIDETREAMKRNKRVLLQAPTGAGKTAITVHMMAKAAQAGKRSCFVVHQNELLSQTSRALWKQKLEHGVIAAGKASFSGPMQVASVRTLINRTSQYKPFDLIIIDEAHRSTAASYSEVLKAYPDAWVIGLTATPQRTDGKGLGDMYDTMIQGPTIRQLIDAGYLCDYDMYAPPIALDMSAVRTVAGDFDRKESEKELNKPSITGDAVGHYIKMANGKRCVVMCVTINHAKDVASQYNSAGIPAACIDGTMTSKERDALLERFRSGELLVVTNAQLMIEGVDVPGIEVVQWLRPTQSLIVWMQGNGRGFRTHEGKESLIILDHVGNSLRHGLPCADRAWSLAGKQKGKRKTGDEADIGIQSCQACFKVFRSGVRECPHCGAKVEFKERKLEVVDGELQRVEVDLFARRAERIEQGQARGLEELVAIGVRRNMKNPAFWAATVFAARDKRKPTQEEIRKARNLAIAMRQAA